MRNRDIAFVCVLCAAVVAATGNDGWGWFLFAALLLS